MSNSIITQADVDNVAEGTCFMQIVFPAKGIKGTVSGHTEEELQQKLCDTILGLRNTYPHELSYVDWDRQIVMPNAPMQLVSAVRRLVILAWNRRETA